MIAAFSTTSQSLRPPSCQQFIRRDPRALTKPSHFISPFHLLVSFIQHHSTPSPQSSSRMVYCKECQKKVRSENGYLQHLKSSKKHAHNPENSWHERFSHECSHCGRRYPSQKALDEHHEKAISHPYCMDCKRMFLNENCLREVSCMPKVFLDCRCTCLPADSIHVQDNMRDPMSIVHSVMLVSFQGAVSWYVIFGVARDNSFQDRFHRCYCNPANEQTLTLYLRYISNPEHVPTPTLIERVLMIPSVTWTANIESQSQKSRSPESHDQAIKLLRHWLRLGLGTAMATDVACVLENSILYKL